MVHNYYQVPGGEDTVVNNEKTLLEMNGHNVVLYTRNNSELKSLSIMGKLLLPLSTIFSIKTFREIRKLIKNNNIQIVHVHNTLTMISPAVYYAAYSCNIPVIQTIHNFRLLCPGATFYRNGHICEECVEKNLMCSVRYGCYRKSKIQTLLCAVNTTIHRATGIYKKLNYICLTDFNKKKLLELKQINENQIYVKPNFVLDTDYFVPQKDRFNQVIFVGRLDKLKGVDFLLRTWNKFEKLYGDSIPELHIYGSGPLEKWCDTYVNEHKSLKIKLKGFISNSEVRHIIGSSKALILPTQWYEGFPMSIVEAYSVGTPVIGSDIGNVGSLIENGVLGYTFTLNDKNSLIKSILNINMLDCEKIKEIFNLKYSQCVNYEELISIYRDAIERKK